MEKKAEKALTAIWLTIDPSKYTRKIADLMRQFYKATKQTDLQLHNTITKVSTQLEAIGVKLQDITVIDVLIINLDGEKNAVIDPIDFR